MLKTDYAREVDKICEQHREDGVIQAMFSTLPGLPSDVLGREAAADSSTMRLNSTTTSGEILSQSKLLV